jgi:hypothetical protein
VVIVSSIIFYSIKKTRRRKKSRIIQVKRPDSVSPLLMHTSSTLAGVKPRLNFVLNLPLYSFSVGYSDVESQISFKSTTS